MRLATRTAIVLDNLGVNDPEVQMTIALWVNKGIKLACHVIQWSM